MNLDSASAYQQSRIAWRRDELARAVGLCTRQIVRLEERGDLKSVRVGRAVLVTDESVRSWLASLQSPQAAA